MAVPERSTLLRNTIVFDLGGVLIDWNPRYLYRTLFEDEERMEWFLANVCTPAWNHEQDAGRPFEDAVDVAIERFPEHEALIRAYYERWDEMLGGSIVGSVDVLDDLRQQAHPLYALTNWSAETFPIARERYPFLDWFDGIVVSGQIGVAKPEPDIFHHLLSEYELDAEDTIFIDDNAENVAAAQALGMHGIHFRSPSHLRRVLKQVGLL